MAKAFMACKTESGVRRKTLWHVKENGVLRKTLRCEQERVKPRELMVCLSEWCVTK